MASPITWRNVGSNIDFRGASRMMDSARQGITQGISGIEKLLNDRYQAQVDKNTDAYMDTVAGMSLEELQAARADGTLEKMRAGYNGRVDADAIRGYGQNRIDSLLDRENVLLKRDQANERHDLDVEKLEQNLKHSANQESRAVKQEARNAYTHGQKVAEDERTAFDRSVKKASDNILRNTDSPELALEALYQEQPNATAAQAESLRQAAINKQVRSVTPNAYQQTLIDQGTMEIDAKYKYAQNPYKQFDDLRAAGKNPMQSVMDYVSKELENPDSGLSDYFDDIVGNRRVNTLTTARQAMEGKLEVDGKKLPPIPPSYVLETLAMMDDGVGWNDKSLKQLLKDHVPITQLEEQYTAYHERNAKIKLRKQQAMYR